MSSMRTATRISGGLAVALVTLLASGAAPRPDENAQLLQTREAVWRAWFANDTKALHELVPPDTIVISSGEEEWKRQAGVFQTAADFHAAGGKLVRLEFPRTEVQRFGDVAIIWSKYIVETDVNGKSSTSSGRVTEIFVRRDGRWTNPGWHTDSEK
jgi:ketosteroid isomerase-like protein